MTVKCRRHDTAWTVASVKLRHLVFGTPWATELILPEDRSAERTPSTNDLGASRNLLTRSEVRKVGGEQPGHRVEEFHCWLR